ncbi:SDR family oxidoreductase [Pelagibacteraceae bacterium]|jgi:3-oxoacyl-[acyl-carrier protein] reductase|nr:SDR family oxidoreductase [Pelagibacteraceae bacterium]
MIIVTGASRGLGAEVFKNLKEKHDQVIGLARNGDEKSNILECDISNLESIKLAANKIKKIDNKLYALINVAGIASMNLALATPENMVRKIIDVNLLGTIFTNQTFAPQIIRNKKGRIINFSTIAVKLGIKGESVYVASKAGVEGFSRSLARELSPFNITVNCIAPGPIKTDLLRGVSDIQIKNITDQQIFNKTMLPSDIVDYVNILLSDEAKHISGQVFTVGGS